MKTLYLLRFNRLARVGGLYLAFLLLMAPFARAGLTLEIHVYCNTQGASYGFYTPMYTNATAPAAVLGTYVISSPQWPTNGTQRGYDLTTNGVNDRYEFDINYGYSDLGSTLFQITNGTWSILFTNTTTTNVYTFTVSAPVADSNLLPATIVTFPAPGSIISNNQTNFTWQGPTSWTGSGGQQVYNSDSYYQSANLPPAQTNWNVDSALPTDTNFSFSLQYLTTNSFFTVGTPLRCV